jgi:hypothetical protein
MIGSLNELKKEILPRRRGALAAFVMTVVMSVGTSCAPRTASGPAEPQESTATPTLDFLDLLIIPSTPISVSTDRARQFGSVSGLVRDAWTGRYLAVIDDRQPARAAWIEIAFDGRLHVTVLGWSP